MAHGAGTTMSADEARKRRMEAAAPRMAELLDDLLNGDHISPPVRRQIRALLAEIGDD